MESLIFLTMKCDGRIKARMCANGSVQREWMNREEASSPTAITESILMTATIEAEEGRDVATVDIPNAFIQTPVETEGTDKIIMKIRDLLVDILVQLDPDHYGPKVMTKGSGRNMVLYVQVHKAIYGVLQSALLLYK